MPPEKSRARLIFRVTSDKLSITATDGRICVVAPVGEPEGPFHISIIKFEAGESGKFVGSWPISQPIATHEEAIAQLHVGFEFSPPPPECPEPLHSLITEVTSAGLIRPVFPLDTQTN